MKVWIVEIESGSSEEGNAHIFDSVWTTEEGAQKYAENKYGKQRWPYFIDSVLVDQPN